MLTHPGEPLMNGGQVLRYLRNPQVLLDWNLNAVEVVNAGTTNEARTRYSIGWEQPCLYLERHWSWTHPLQGAQCSRLPQRR